MSKHEDPTRREVLSVCGATAAATVIGTAGLGEALAEAQEQTPQVPRRRLGKTGEEIPILLFGGAVSLDPRFDPKLAEALRYGVSYIDAADCYKGGACEPAVASFQQKAKVRDKLWITTKSDKHDPKGFEQTVNTSLRKLKTDYIDMYYLHMLKDKSFLSPELARTVDMLKKAGLIRHFGFSCHHANVAELLAHAAGLPWVESVMFRYNFRQYGDRALNRAIDAAAKADIGLIAMKTQGSEASFRKAWRKFEQTGKWNKYQAVLKAVWEDKRITAAVSAMDTLEKVRQNVAAALDRSKLGQADREAIVRYADATRHFACDGCDHICGAAVTAPVRIGDTLRMLMYHDVYGEPEKARTLFRALPAEARALAGVDFSAAEAACPHGFKLRAHLERAAKVLA